MSAGKEKVPGTRYQVSGKNKKQKPETRNPTPDTWKKLDALRGPATLAEKPAGAFTIKEYAERYGVDDSTAAREINKLERSGAVIFVGKLRGSGGARVYKLKN